MDELPVPIRPAYVVSPEGQVMRCEPPQPPAPPARPLTRLERLDAYRAGISATANTLRELGFQTHYECEHSVSMEFRGYLFDFRIQKPGNVAHITSAPGSTIANRKATIYKLSDEVKSEFALQMIISKEFSARPIFVALEESLPDPAKTIKEAVLGFLASLNAANHRLGKATVGQKALDVGPQALPEWVETALKSAP